MAKQPVRSSMCKSVVYVLLFLRMLLIDNHSRYETISIFKSAGIPLDPGLSLLL